MLTPEQCERVAGLATKCNECDVTKPYEAVVIQTRIVICAAVQFNGLTAEDVAGLSTEELNELAALTGNSVNDCVSSGYIDIGDESYAEFLDPITEQFPAFEVPE